jgi:sugar phosphate isomerase/epimerase
MSWDRSYESPHCSKQDIDDLIAFRDKDQVTLGAHIWEDLAQSTLEEGQNNLLEWVDLCEQTGVKNLVLHGGTSADRRKGISDTRRILGSVLPRLESAGVVLNLENHYAYDYHDCRELCSEPWEFLDVLSLDSPSLGFCFDTGHGHMTRNSKDLIQTLAPWLHYIHLADNQGTDDDHDMFREGTVEWDKVFAHLQDIHFDGTFCVEFPVRENKAPFQLCVKEIRDRWRDADDTVNTDK